MNWSDPEHDVMADVQQVYEESGKRTLTAIEDSLNAHRAYDRKTQEYIDREIIGKASRRGDPVLVDGSYVFRVPARSGKDRSLRGKARKKARRG